MGYPSTNTPESREVRVFLSSTFRDFMEERELLVKQVFPALNRRARERGVEVVEVDLRWGVTQKQVENGKALEFCLKQIERCRPYFVGMLGDSYGSITPPQQQLIAACPGLLEERQWLDGRIGSASYTELEIEHSLQMLCSQEMKGHAFFYFRDATWSDAKVADGQTGWRTDTPEEREKLERLKQRIRNSNVPLIEGLRNPQDIAAQIQTDLWELIDRQYPERQQDDSLEQENRKHASYRQSRIGPGNYVGGDAYISQLEQWIREGQQQILITGESGSGKSSLLANWMAAHEQKTPKDVLYAHHLGCTNDANAVRPMLARMIDNASRLLIAEGELPKALEIPVDWWELTACVADTQRRISAWCSKSGRRWIWVLDGLDRLDLKNQKALPWLPQALPKRIHVIVSALDCPAVQILRTRNYTNLTVQGLRRVDQEKLITRVLERYAKQLDGDLKKKILEHQLANSPLFLRVLLEELRQCGRFDSLKEQLTIYLRSETVNQLYERVLERLSQDGHGEATRRVMTTIWASRRGLTETELLAITGLAPLQWAPIDLALEKGFGRNGHHLVFDHEFLRKAVQDRYLPQEKHQRQAHSDLADWYQQRRIWNERTSEELPWQLKKSGRLNDLRKCLSAPSTLATLQSHRGSREIINYWQVVRRTQDGELDELIARDLDKEIEKRRKSPNKLILFLDRIAAIFDEAGLYRQSLVNLLTLSLNLKESSNKTSDNSILNSLQWLANTHRNSGNLDSAISLYQRCLQTRERLLGAEHPDTLSTISNLGIVLSDKGDYEKAEVHYIRCLQAQERVLGTEHPLTLATVNLFAALYSNKGNYGRAQELYIRCLEARERLLGTEHPDTLTTVNNLATLYWTMGDYEQAYLLFKRCLKTRESLLGEEHPDTLMTVNNLASLYWSKGEYRQAESFYMRCLEARERLLGVEHPDTLGTVNNLATLQLNKGDYAQAEAFYLRCLEAKESVLGAEHPDTLMTLNNLGFLYFTKGDYEKAQAHYIRCLKSKELVLGSEHPDTLSTVNNLGILSASQGDFDLAEIFFSRCLDTQGRLLGVEHPDTLGTVNNLGLLLIHKGEYDKAQSLLSRCLEARERLLGAEHPETLSTVNNLGLLLTHKGDYDKAKSLFCRCLEARERLLGAEHPDTLDTINHLNGLSGKGYDR